MRFSAYNYTMSDAKPVGRRKRGPRFIEIAEAAGVSPTTVNRVLNERGSVSAATRARVVAAAKQLGVPRLLPETRRGLTRFDVILARSDTPYFHRLNLALQRSMQMIDKKVVMHRTFIQEDDDDRIAHAILSPPQKRHGLIVAVHDTERVSDALCRVIKSGVPVVTLMSDIVDVPRLHYAGIDNYRAGRTAGYFLGRLAQRSGRVLLVSNSLIYRAHAERTNGCRDVIAEMFPALECSAINECHDDADQCYLAVMQALNKYDDLVGIYNSGAGSSGIEAALRKSGRAGKVVWIGHEKSDEHRQYLENRVMDLVIDQDPDGQAVSSLQHLLYACGMIEDAPSREPNEFRFLCHENIWHGAYLR